MTRMPFQLRLEVQLSDMVRSIREHGQQVPAILRSTGNGAFEIIDGHRRCLSLKEVGASSVRAECLGLDDAQALELAYSINRERKNYTTIDRAHAAWQARARGHSCEEVGRMFNLTRRQITRYLDLLRVRPPILELVKDGTISMAHALVMEKRSVHEARRVAEVVTRDQLSAKQLDKLLCPEHEPRPRLATRDFFTRSEEGFRLKGIHVTRDLPRSTLDDLHRQLLKALELLGSYELDAADD